MIDNFQLAGVVVTFTPNDYGAELELEVNPPKSEPFVAKVKLYKEQAEAYASRFTPGTAVLVFGQIKANKSKKTGDWFTYNAVNDVFFPAGKSELAKPAPQPAPQLEEDDSIPF